MFFSLSYWRAYCRLYFCLLVDFMSYQYSGSLYFVNLYLSIILSENMFKNVFLNRISIYLRRYDGEVSVPLVGHQGSRVSMRVARGSASLLPIHGRGIWPRDVLKKVSRGLSRVEAGNPGFPRLVQVTSGGFSWWL